MIKQKLNRRSARLQSYEKFACTLNKPKPKPVEKSPKSGDTYQDYINRKKMEVLLRKSGLMSPNISANNRRNNSKNTLPTKYQTVSVSSKVEPAISYIEKLSRNYAEIIYKPDERFRRYKNELKKHSSMVKFESSKLSTLNPPVKDKAIPTFKVKIKKKSKNNMNSSVCSMRKSQSVVDMEFKANVFPHFISPRVSVFYSI